MSWHGLALLVKAFEIYRDRDVDEDVMAKLGKLGEIGFLKRYMRPGAEELSPEDLGRRIDDALVEHINLNLPDPMLGKVDAEAFNAAMVKIEEGRRENPALRAFKARLWRDEGVTLASAIYLSLARRHIRRLTNLGKSDGQRRPNIVEGRQFARSQLHPFMDESFRNSDWKKESFAKDNADRWLQNPSQYKLFKLIIDSKKSAVAFDTLQLITRGFDDAIEERPALLLHWNFEVASGQRTRPHEGPTPRGRPDKLGNKLRDNEIRHTVTLLTEVGMTKTAAYTAVAEEFQSPESPIKSASTVRGICRKPYLTIDELGEDAMKHIEPAFYAHLYGPGYNSAPLG